MDLAIAVDLDLARLAVGIDRRRGFNEWAQGFDGLADGPLGAIFTFSSVGRCFREEGEIDVSTAGNRLPQG